MKLSTRIETFFGGQSGRRYWSIAGFLASVLLGTAVFSLWQAETLEGSMQGVQADVVDGAIAAIEDHFAGLQAEMLAQAMTIAESPVVLQELRNRRQSRMEGAFLPEALPEALIRYFAALAPQENDAVELYDLEPRLVAWKGFSMPLDDALQKTRFLETYQTAISRDGDLRTALVIWHPVKAGGEVLGAVRVMHRVAFRAPVQNQYLSDYSIEEQWRRMVHLPVKVSFDGAVTADVSPAQAQVRMLQGIDGTVLGRVIVTPPAVADLAAEARARSSDVMAFWTTLLLFWLVAGLWMWRRLYDKTRLSEPSRKEDLHGAVRFLCFAAAWWGMRFILLELHVPDRWQTGKAPLAPLFDPRHFASTLGAGLLRSTGDLFITALFAFFFGIAFLHFASRLRAGFSFKQLRLREREATPLSPVLFGAILMVAVPAITGVTYLLALVTRHAILDSTLDYFERTGLTMPVEPERLVLVVFCGLLLSTMAAMLVTAAIAWIAIRGLLRHMPFRRPIRGLALVLSSVVLVQFAILYGFFDAQRVLPWPTLLIFLLLSFGLASFFLIHRIDGLELLTLRGVLLAVFLFTLLLYPMFNKGMDAGRRMQMLDAAEFFDQGRDPRIVFAIEQLLETARSKPEMAGILAGMGGEARNWLLDSLAVDLLRGSMLSSFGSYDVSLTILTENGGPVGRYYQAEQTLGNTVLDQIDSSEFDVLRQMYAEKESGALSPMVQQVTGRLERDRFQYAGIAPLHIRGNERITGWIMARAEPRVQSTETPFPRVLLPGGVLSNLRANLSLAQFRDGVLLHSAGRNFGRYRLGEKVREALNTQPVLWQVEDVERRLYLTYYQRQDVSGVRSLQSQTAPSVSKSVVAVRTPAINTFDHLYYLLRLTVAGLFVGLPLYLAGLYLRRRAGLLPAPRVRFRDKVLNAFLVVGIISVAAVGFVGRTVVVEEKEGAVQVWLQQHLEQIERTLESEAHGDELPHQVLDRVRVDSLAALLGLDLNIYRGERLVALSRPQLLRDRLIDERLPAEVYQALYHDGYRFALSEAKVGNFTYTAGFRAILNEQGQPRYVLSVPTLPEQERIEEERARTIAYLFGSLLLLVLVVMLTASVLANALARPIGRLRAGLEAVAKGQFERSIPVNTRDEIGELVQTFNAMQEQLAESRRKLAQQERQLAWREMARQVAHEIKNPLTPMKLSVQHLRRAFYHLHPAQSEIGDPAESKFTSLFDRITHTLIEQIDTLARIANEFHSFARMPTRMMERLDLNAVVDEAVSLMQEETDAEIKTELSIQPLIVEADREELRRIFINLIKNALQAIPGNVAGRVEIRTAAQAGSNGQAAWAYSTVSDNGAGIQPDLRDKIFEPNFSTKTSGTGLGLAIARKGVEDLHGEIGFETQEGSGTMFWVKLPLLEG